MDLADRASELTCENARMCDSHQQYLAKNPDGYCGLGGTGVRCPVGLVS